MTTPLERSCNALEELGFRFNGWLEFDNEQGAMYCYKHRNHFTYYAEVEVDGSINGETPTVFFRNFTALKASL